ncbi:MAG: hypothetical protein ACOX8Q_10505, partial [Christensenellales bacterium]
MKRYIFVLCTFLLMIAVIGCSSSNKTNPAVLETPAATQTPRPAQSFDATAAPSPAETVQTVVDTTLTLNFAFGQKTGTYSGPIVNGVPEGTGS